MDTVLDAAPFAGRNTSAKNYNGVIDVVTRYDLRPMMPFMRRKLSSGVTAQTGPIAQPSPFGVRLQLDATNPKSAAIMKFMARGSAFGIIYGIDQSDTAGGTTPYFQDSLVVIKGEDFIPPRTAEAQNSITPISTGGRTFCSAIWEDFGNDPYTVEIRTPGDRLNTTANRFVIYSFLMDPKYLGEYGYANRLTYSTGTVPVSSNFGNDHFTVNDWYNAGSQPVALSAIDITNTTGSPIVVVVQLDHNNQTHYKTVPANDTLTVFSSPIPVVVDPTAVSIMASASGLRYTMYGTSGF